jgi:hypothetical protein
MKIMYDVEHLPERKSGGKESEELLALKAFLAGTQRNMVIEYEEENSAKSRYNALRKFRSDNKLQDVFELYRREKVICIIRSKKRK